MTVTTVSWGGSNLAHPEEDGGVTIDDAALGSNQRMLNGTLRAEVIAEKARITMKWDGLTATERGTLRTAYDAKKDTANTLITPDNQSFSVIAVNGWRETPWFSHAGTIYYNVTITFDEV